jgi:hypothetical protein
MNPSIRQMNNNHPEWVGERGLQLVSVRVKMKRMHKHCAVSETLEELEFCTCLLCILGLNKYISIVDVLRAWFLTVREKGEARTNAVVLD